MWMGVPGSADVSAHASAQFVVPRSMPTTKREVTGWSDQETSTSAGATTLWPVDGRGGKATRVASHPR